MDQFKPGPIKPPRIKADLLDNADLFHTTKKGDLIK